MAPGRLFTPQQVVAAYGPQLQRADALVAAAAAGRGAVPPPRFQESGPFSALVQVREVVDTLLQAGGGNQRTMRHWKGELKKLVDSGFANVAAVLLTELLEAAGCCADNGLMLGVAPVWSINRVLVVSGQAGRPPAGQAGGAVPPPIGYRGFAVLMLQEAHGVREARAVFMNEGAVSPSRADALKLAGVRLCYEADACAAHLHGYANYRERLRHYTEPRLVKLPAWRRAPRPAPPAKPQAGREQRKRKQPPAAAPPPRMVKRWVDPEEEELEDDAGSRPVGDDGAVG